MKKLINIALHTVFGVVLLVAGASAQATELSAQAQIDVLIAEAVQQTRIELAESARHDQVAFEQEIANLQSETETSFERTLAE